MLFCVSATFLGPFRRLRAERLSVSTESEEYVTTSSKPASKGDQTRQHIYQTAAECFSQSGYDAVSMREIAAKADVSVGLIYHYFGGKEDIARCWYIEQVEALAAAMAGLPTGQLADRYRQALELNLRRLRPMRGAMLALFAGAMRSDAAVSLMDSPPGHRLSRSYRQLVLDSDDALRESTAADLGIVLYMFHMLLLVFWLYDRSPGQASTERLLGFAHEMIKLLRPMFFLPMVPQGIAKLARIVMPDRRGGTDSVSAAAQDDAGNGQHENLNIHG